MRGLAALAIMLALAGCSGSDPVATPTSPSAAPTPSTTPAATLEATVTITANNQVPPAEVRVRVGGRVTFVNQNNRAHDITSDPPHLHTDCPAIMEGQTGVLTQARTCGFTITCKRTIRTCKAGSSSKGQINEGT